jgi:hypothetical protein
MFSAFSIQHSAFSIQHSAFSIQQRIAILGGTPSDYFFAEVVFI